MKDILVFTSGKEPPEVSVEVVRRGLEFLSQRCLSPDGAAVLSRHKLEMPRPTAASPAATKTTRCTRPARAEIDSSSSKAM